MHLNQDESFCYGIQYSWLHLSPIKMDADALDADIYETKNQTYFIFLSFYYATESKLLHRKYR